MKLVIRAQFREHVNNPAKKSLEWIWRGRS
jgi:hypothetical protein